MSILQFLLLLLVAGVCGSLGQTLAGFSRGGCLVSIALGFVGALVGTWLARLLGLPAIFTLHIEGSLSRWSGRFWGRLCSSRCSG